MKLLKAIIRPNKVDDVKDAGQIEPLRHDGHRGARTAN
jgi:nitrogen regulatory protein PII